ncbi:MAG: HAD family hydrolase [Elusimicrobiaceae bacterium]|nr:HAD family hydrolase [Elusimicrobiaceae bacterium]
MKAILFDHGGTIDSNGTAWKELFFPLYLECGIPVSNEQFDRAFYDADDNLSARHRLQGLGLAETVLLQVTDVLENLRMEDSVKAEKIAGEFVKNCRMFFARNKPVLAALAKKFRLGVVSNNYGNLESMLNSEGLLEYFGAVADSGAVGSAKPDKGIFLHALDRLAVSPRDAMMVGDCARRDIAGALALDMRAAFLRGSRKEQALPQDWGARVIVLDSLQELPEKLAAGGF